MTARTRPPAHRLLAGAWLACAALALAATPARAEWSRVAHFCTGKNPQLGCATAFTGGPGDNVMTADPPPAARPAFWKPARERR